MGDIYSAYCKTCGGLSGMTTHDLMDTRMGADFVRNELRKGNQIRLGRDKNDTPWCSCPKPDESQKQVFVVTRILEVAVIAKTYEEAIEAVTDNDLLPAEDEDFQFESGIARFKSLKSINEFDQVFDYQTYEFKSKKTEGLLDG